MEKTVGDKPTVFVAEDDEDILALLTFLLEREGYCVVSAQDGRAAIKMIDEVPCPQLGLLDIMMPYADGFQLIKHIRESQTWKKVPVIMLTTKTGEKDIVRALDAGANDYINKPFKPAELAARIRRLTRGP